MERHRVKLKGLFKMINWSNKQQREEKKIEIILLSRWILYRFFSRLVHIRWNQNTYELGTLSVQHCMHTNDLLLT